MEYVALTAATVVFALCLHWFRVAGIARRILSDSGQAVTTMRLAALSDDEKESAVQRAALSVGGAFIALLVRIVASLVLSLAVVCAGFLLNAYSPESVMEAAVNGYFIAGSSLFIIAAMIYMR